jgi:hypothetical protein
VKVRPVVLEEESEIHRVDFPRPKELTLTAKSAKVTAKNAKEISSA